MAAIAFGGDAAIARGGVYGGHRNGKPRDQESDKGFGLCSDGGLAGSRGIVEEGSVGSQSAPRVVCEACAAEQSRSVPQKGRGMMGSVKGGPNMSHISQAKLDLRGTGCVLLAVAGLSLRAWPVLAQQQNDPPPTTGSLVQLLESKGILTPQEAAMVSQASTGGEARGRLAQLLVSKRLITQDEYNRIFGAPTDAATKEGSTGAHPTERVLP